MKRGVFFIVAAPNMSESPSFCPTGKNPFLFYNCNEVVVMMLDSCLRDLHLGFCFS